MNVIHFHLLILPSLTSPYPLSSTLLEDISKTETFAVSKEQIASRIDNTILKINYLGMEIPFREYSLTSFLTLLVYSEVVSNVAIIEQLKLSVDLYR